MEQNITNTSYEHLMTPNSQTWLKCLTLWCRVDINRFLDFWRFWDHTQHPWQANSSMCKCHKVLILGLGDVFLFPPYVIDYFFTRTNYQHSVTQEVLQQKILSTLFISAIILAHLVVCISYLIYYDKTLCYFFSKVENPQKNSAFFF